MQSYAELFGFILLEDRPEGERKRRSKERKSRSRQRFHSDNTATVLRKEPSEEEKISMLMSLGLSSVKGRLRRMNAFGKRNPNGGVAEGVGANIFSPFEVRHKYLPSHLDLSGSLNSERDAEAMSDSSELFEASANPQMRSGQRNGVHKGPTRGCLTNLQP